MTTLKRKPRVDHAARREAYVGIAAQVLLERGLHAATMRDFAEAANAPKVLFYRLFPSREALVEAVFDRVLQALENAYASPWEGYGSMVGKLLATARQDPAPFLVVLKNCRTGPSGSDWEPRLRAALRETSLPLFKPGPNAPEGAEVRSQHAAGALFGLLIDSMITWLEDRDGLDDATRIKWWGHIVREARKATREAFRLD